MLSSNIVYTFSNNRQRATEDIRRLGSTGLSKKLISHKSRH